MDSYEKELRDLLRLKSPQWRYELGEFLKVPEKNKWCFDNKDKIKECEFAFYYMMDGTGIQG